MKIKIKKISEEKFEVTITDGDSVIFNDSRYHYYMGEQMVTKDSIENEITQLSELFGEFTEIENDFDI